MPQLHDIESGELASKSTSSNTSSEMPVPDEGGTTGKGDRDQQRPSEQLETGTLSPQTDERVVPLTSYTFPETVEAIPVYEKMEAKAKATGGGFHPTYKESGRSVPYESQIEQAMRVVPEETNPTAVPQEANQTAPAEAHPTAAPQETNPTVKKGGPSCLHWFKFAKRSKYFPWNLICLLLLVVAVSVTLGVTLAPEPEMELRTDPPTELPRKSFESTKELQAVVDLYLEGVLQPEYGWPIGSWNVSLIEDFSELFSYYRTPKAVYFNEDISGWDTSSATNMSAMFRGYWDDLDTVNYHRFNQDLSSWNVSDVTDMSWMFSCTLDFNRSLSTWQVSKVTDMTAMFCRAYSFDQDLSAWNVSSVINMRRMFNGALRFNGNLSTWDVSNVEKMWSMFSGAKSFNGDLSAWDVSNVRTMWWMFKETERFNANLSSWNVSGNTNTAGMFLFAKSFNQDLSSWDVSKLEHVYDTFHGATAFRQDLCKWGNLLPSTINVQNMFRDTNCEDKSDPDLNKNPRGPFCFPCNA